MHFNSPVRIHIYVFFIRTYFLFVLTLSTHLSFILSLFATYNAWYRRSISVSMCVCVHYPFGCIKYVWTVSLWFFFLSSFCLRWNLPFFFCFIRSVLFHRNLINFPCKFYLWLFNEHVAIPYCKYIRLPHPTCKTIGLMWPTTHTNHNKFNIQNICAIDLKMSQFEFNKVSSCIQWFSPSKSTVRWINSRSFTLHFTNTHHCFFLLLNSHLIWLHTFPWSSDWLYEHWNTLQYNTPIC